MVHIHLPGSLDKALLMKFDVVHEHFTALAEDGPRIAIGLDWLKVKAAAQSYALATGKDVIVTKVTVIRAPNDDPIQRMAKTVTGR